MSPNDTPAPTAPSGETAASKAGFCGRSLGTPGWFCTRPPGHERNLTPCHALAPYGARECERCDGCGWYEGGTALRSGCEKCNGTGYILPPMPTNDPTAPRVVGGGEALPDYTVDEALAVASGPGTLRELVGWFLTLQHEKMTRDDVARQVAGELRAIGQRIVGAHPFDASVLAGLAATVESRAASSGESGAPTE